MQPLLQRLIQLQTDLNALTMHCIGTNSALTDIIALYERNDASYTVVHEKVTKLGMSLCKMSDALEKFQTDAEKLGDHFNA